LVCSSIVSILFPIFASYKALNANDPAQLTPWLMYWVVLSCVMLVEGWTSWITMWYIYSPLINVLPIHITNLLIIMLRIPFFAWARACALLYLVLPQTQGAKIVYIEHIHPFLRKHEVEIENFISRSHEQAKSLGLMYLKRAIQFFKETVLGIQHQPSPPPTPAGYGYGAATSTYAQNLLGRFRVPPIGNLPSAAAGAGGAAGDFYGFLSSALLQSTGAGTSSSREMQAEDLSASGTLIPSSMTSPEEKRSFISLQRSRLQVLLSALDKEASNLDTTYTSAAGGVDTAARDGGYLATRDSDNSLSRSRSEPDFEKVERDDADDSEAHGSPKPGWGIPWGFGRTPSSAESYGGPHGGTDTAHASGVDRGY
jgi:receptor expression-enhancing protein 1/2/3/4